MVQQDVLSNGGSNTAFPARVIVIGAGIFGLSTALAIANRHPSTSITIIDRMTPPVLDGSSVDTTRCIRSDYSDPVYARLAREAQIKFEDDAGLSQYMHKQGMTFVFDGQPGRFTELWKKQKAVVETMNRPEDIVNMPDRCAVFQSIHGRGSQPVAKDNLVMEESRWNVAYCNLNNAFIDAKACVQVYYERCLAQKSITFRCGTAVDHILLEDKISRGVVLENGRQLFADTVVVAAGAWSSRLVHLGQRVRPLAHEVAWIKVTPNEEKQWKRMAITTNLSTGINIFPPYKGEIKILRRSPGYVNTVQVPHPENRSETIEISNPRTIVTNPTDVIPLDAETELRNNLKEIFPSLADRPFDRTKLCWISATPTADFLIAPHPRIPGIQLATAGSAHAWKFLPTIGDFVVDSMEKNLSSELATRWAFERTAKGPDESAPRMEGEPQELCEMVRSALFA